MCNIVLSDDLSIRSYFEKVLNLSKLGDKFPVNLDDVWPLVYSAKEKAVRALVSSDPVSYTHLTLPTNSLV